MPEDVPFLPSAVPLVVISFNRPHYLTDVLDSLAAQTALSGRRVFLFQDNTVSPYSQRRYARDEEAAACIAAFKERFPAGEVLLAPHNLGVARNFLRAEEFVFTDLNSEVAYFFEDDMVLSPHYLTMMDHIYGHVRKGDDVGYFAAYGAHKMPIAQQRENASRVRRLRYHWAFGVTRKNWLALRAWMQPYYEMSEGLDYKSRRHTDICRYYRGRGFPVDVTTQDHTKKVGTASLGRASIQTLACFGRYIGEKDGLHTTAKSFAGNRYADTELYPEPVEVAWPSSDEFAKIRNLELAIHRARIDGDKPPMASLVNPDIADLTMG